MTTSQRTELDDLLKRYGVLIGPTDADGDLLAPLDLAQVGDGRPVVLEIGFGMGAATLAMAVADPTRTILAVDVHTPGVLRLLRGVAAQGLPNVVVAHGDALDLIRHRIPSNSLAGIRIFFPDPWPKLRHHKRRMVRPDVVSMLSDRLLPAGTIHLATDIADYADQMLAVCTAEPLLHNMFAESSFAPGRMDRPPTKFEIQGEQQGRPSYDLVFQR